MTLDLTDLRPRRAVDPDGLTLARELVHARLDAAPRAPRRPRARRPVLVGAAATAAGLAALVLPGPADQAAFAGWTSVPAALSPDEAAAAAAQCLDVRTAEDAGLPAGDHTLDNLDGADAVLADRRGATTFTVLASDAGVQSCLIGPGIRTSSVLTGDGGTTVDAAASGSEQIGVAEVGSAAELPGADGATYLSGGVHGYGTAEPWGFGIGRVGAAVTAVEVRLADGSTVRASVGDGVWAAWWPREELVAAVLPTLADGTSGQAPAIEASDVDVVIADAREAARRAGS